MSPLTPQTLAGLIPRPLPSDPKTRALAEQILAKGYTIIPDAFTPTSASLAIKEIQRLTSKDGPPKATREAFWGYKTNRIFALPNKSRVFDPFYTLPQVLALNDYFLDPEYLMYVIQSIVIHPGEKQQVVHHDDGVTKLLRPRAPVSIGVMIVLEDYTVSNGATRIIPGSHLWGDETKPNKRDTIPAVCKAGSVVYFLGTTFHSGGPNTSLKPRHALTIQYCQPWIRPLVCLFCFVVFILFYCFWACLVGDEDVC